MLAQFDLSTFLLSITISAQAMIQTMMLVGKCIANRPSCMISGMPSPLALLSLFTDCLASLRSLRGLTDKTQASGVRFCQNCLQTSAFFQDT